MRRGTSISVGILCLLAPLSAMAAPAQQRDREPWIVRHKPVKHQVELGVYGGINILSTRHELFEVDESDQTYLGFKRFNRVAPDFGARVGYFPIPHFGIEIDGNLQPTKTRDDNPKQDVLLWNFRGHVVGQVGLWSVTPFVLFGGGVGGVRSNRAAVGNESDPQLHWGGGLKFHVHRFVQIRVETRDNIVPKQGGDTGLTNNWEILAGLTITLGKKKRKNAEPEPESEPKPEPPRDGDGDGIPDIRDRCPEKQGVEPDGCPLPDRDADGFLDDVDRCPDDPGIEPDGCPNADKDGDGIADAADRCPDDPETKNGYQDADGCPDEVPAEVGRFEGTLAGVNFQRDKDTLTAKAAQSLDTAVEALKKYPEFRIEISGHTDSTGSDTYNMDLSKRRADAVKRYLVDNGVADDRIQTRGAGPHEPVDSNVTTEGRARNRRIEFKILK